MGESVRRFVRLGMVSAFFAAAGASGCSDAPVAPPPLEDGCRSCHGGLRSPAPPKALDGSEDPSSPGVGAHAAHLFGARLGGPVACNECHLEPTTLDSLGHIDTPLPAELTFGPLATLHDLTPAWDRAALTCSNTYCHGATLSGGAATSPIWNVVDGSQSDCGSCHGNPPPAPHPRSLQCQSCHAPVAGPRQTIADPSRHGDGKLDVVEVAACLGCHGSATNAAPPSNLAGANDTTELTVGAHQVHLSGGRQSKPVACAQCHLVPAKLEDPGHVDTAEPAELTFGDVARANGATPTWRRDEAACSNTYCHGTAAPIWNVVDGTQAKCGSCHALPPAAPHPANDRCELCHLPTAGPAQTIADRSTHVDGIVQVASETCTGCHGTEENLAPPPNLAGDSFATDRSVGAHQAHLAGGRHSHPVACDTCHLVPTALDDPGHRDSELPAELTFQRLAIHDGATPAWDGNALTCANTYCHGSAELGGSNPSPRWTGVEGDEAACGSCHGLPPPAPHPANDQCALCHAPTAGPGQTIADRNTHLDGILQATDGTCANCHGANDNSAPPIDLDGLSDPALRTVGAHRSHTVGTRGISRPLSCAECHLLPEVLDSPGHVDTTRPAELTWGPLASLGTTPTFDVDSLRCTNTYCHGTTLDGGSEPSPRWTVVDGSQSTCVSCHGMPPTENHPADNRCDFCHLPTAGPGQFIADPNTHVDGILQVAADCDSCHGENGSNAPPLNLDGLRDPTLITVGAHRTHVAGGALSRPVACNECHLVPAHVDSVGHTDTPRPAELVFGPIAAQGGASPSWTSPTCQNTHCHAQGGSNPNPRWNVVNGTEAACGSCHAIPPATPVHQTASDCSNCHLPTAGPNRTVANRATHVDGILQVSAVDCGSCHGGQQSGAPPFDLNGDAAPTDPQVGAHAVHLSGGRFSAPLTCDTCHLVPTQLEEPGHVDSPEPAELTFNGLAAMQGTSPVYSFAAGTCGNTYCHGGATTGGSNVAPTWSAPGSVPCGGCHGLPPAAPHPQVDECALCHAPVAGPGLTIAIPSRHVDGIEDVNDQIACERCHGTAASAAPPPDLDGQTISARVGAHSAHLDGTATSRAVVCAECHVTVNAATPNQSGHYDSARPAEIRFGPLARTAGAMPTKNGASCSNTYCHGATTLGGTNSNPSWTAGAQNCSSCHGAPPPDAVHGNGTATQCESCHPDVAGPGMTIINASRHVDGIIDTSAACDSCHGQNGNPAPPRDLAGLLTSPKVGAHTAHVTPVLGADVACQTCHLVPLQYGDVGHADTAAPAEVSLIGAARADGANPTYNAGQLRCSNTYCHGATMPGGTTNVTWNDGDGSESQCGACHGMPPADTAHSGVAGPNTCNTCHVDSAGPNQIITARTLHVDGVVQVSGGGCTSCHGSPPAPGNESYAGSAGAHARHATTLGFECATCHGNNGSGPNHNPGGRTSVNRNDVNLVFNTNLTFPGGTTMNNGASASYNRTTRTCAVGCHNPRVGNPPEAPNLNNTLTWTAAAPTCVGCHDTTGRNLPLNHDIAALGDAACRECHSATGHTTGAIAIRDPDPTDAFVYSPSNWDGLCKTCHDGVGGTAFGGRPAPNVSPYWTVSSHGAEGYACAECHTYHGSTPSGPKLVDNASANCMAAGCHATLSTQFNQVPGGPISHHRIEGGAGISIKCTDCHNPHLSQAHPNAAIDPDNKWAIYPIPNTARTNRTTSYDAFCLRCHDASAPPGVLGALNIAAERAGGTLVTLFRKGGDALHKEAHRNFGCLNCHHEHGAPGTQGINRGRTLLNYMRVNDFNNGYAREGSCSTPNTPGGFSCH